ncbi:MAG: FKBP-type peptidyl-prolyl cis-trans isomerase [Oscillospiraceae bacterium]|nr:FKBP-type peptidyl-prolyl cis-trans isomerase [Oscillospiraceae bacterium]
MKVAVTYENGYVFQHFGHSSYFKIYECEGTKIVSSRVISTEGSGHEALAILLADEYVDALICGGIGSGAKDALDRAGIQICSGAQGDADAAVQAFINGELQSQGVNCDHHDHEHEEEEEGCGGSCGGGCGGSCGSCGGGCHGAPTVEGPNVGKRVKVHYEGTFNNGEKFDSSYDRGEPMEFLCGMGMMILGFDEAVANMELGQIVNVHLTPDKAYGERYENMVYSFPIAELPGSETLEPGERVALSDSTGRRFPVTVVSRDDTTIVLDANNEMAGKELNFKIELVEINED